MAFWQLAIIIANNTLTVYLRWKLNKLNCRGEHFLQIFSVIFFFPYHAPFQRFKKKEEKKKKNQQLRGVSRQHIDAQQCILCSILYGSSSGFRERQFAHYKLARGLGQHPTLPPSVVSFVDHTFNIFQASVFEDKHYF